jgi:hypothetical protein
MSDRGTPIVISPQEYKSSQIAESKRIAAENPIDEGPEGGRYEVGGEMVDANGKPIKGKANDSATTDQPAIRAERKP